jgi:LysR substrate binding domain
LAVGFAVQETRTARTRRTPACGPGQIGIGALEAPRAYFRENDPYAPLASSPKSPPREQLTSPETIGRAVADAIESPTSQFRWPAGPHAEALLAMRAKLDDQAFDVALRSARKIDCILTTAIRAEFPHLTLLWVEDKTSALVTRLEGGTLDAALLALEAEIGDLEREAIARDPFVLVAAVGNPLAAKTTPVKAAELCDVGMLVLEHEHCFGKQALAFCAGTNAHSLEFRATSPSTIAQMVASGAGGDAAAGAFGGDRGAAAGSPCPRVREAGSG